MPLFLLVTERPITETAAMERLESLGNTRAVANNAIVIRTKDTAQTSKDVSELLFPVQKALIREACTLKGISYLELTLGGVFTIEHFGSGWIRLGTPMANRPTEPRRPEATTPSESAVPYQHPADHSWNLQILLDLKGSVGEIKEAISTLKKDSETQSKKLDSISHQIYAAWAVLIVLLGIGGFLLDKFWNVIAKIVEKGLS